MKMLRIKIYCCLAVLLGCLTACSSEADEPNTDGKATVTVSLSSKAGGTRSSWTLDPTYGEDGEMMKNWFVAVVQNGKILTIVESGDLANEKEIDGFTLVLDAGETTFYSFANMRRADVGLDGITSFPATLPSGFDDQTFSVYGNKTDVSDFPDGIPMSNKQVVNITTATKTVSLEVIRMVAKMHLTLTNITSEDLTIKRIGISDVTFNGADNVYLFPKTTTDGGVETVVPNINEKAASKGTFYTTNIDGNGGSATLAPNESCDVTFYINESEATTTKYFTLMVETGDAAAQRFTMLNWTQIARNDYRSLPVVKINEYKIEFDVTAFTPIGVLPLVENTNGTLKVTLRTYGDFHIQPKVISAADGSTVAYGTDGWTFADGTEGLSLIEANPTIESGNSIFSTAPWLNRPTGMIEAVAAKRNGYALYQMKINVGGNTITYKIEIHTDYQY